MTWFYNDKYSCIPCDSYEMARELAILKMAYGEIPYHQITIDCDGESYGVKQLEREAKLRKMA